MRQGEPGNPQGRPPVPELSKGTWCASRGLSGACMDSTDVVAFKSMSISFLMPPSPFFHSFSLSTNLTCKIQFLFPYPLPSPRTYRDKGMVFSVRISASPVSPEGQSVFPREVIAAS